MKIVIFTLFILTNTAFAECDSKYNWLCNKDRLIKLSEPDNKLDCKTVYINVNRCENEEILCYEFDNSIICKFKKEL